MKPDGIFHTSSSSIEDTDYHLIEKVLRWNIIEISHRKCQPLT